MKNSRKEYLVMFGIVGVLGVAALISAFQIPAGGNLGFGADFMPKVIAVILIFCSLGFLVQAIRTPGEKPAKEKKKIDPVPLIRFFVAMGMLLLYAILLKPVGFVITTILYIFTQSLLMSPPDKRNFLYSGILAVVAALAIYFAFVKGLGMALPAGLLDGIM